MNKLKDAFSAIKAEEELKENTLSFIEKKRSEALKPNRNFFKISLAAAVIALTLLAGIYQLWFVPVTVISIDVNPSVEIEVNRLDRILSANAYNDDGAKILNSVSVAGKKYQDAIDTLLQNEEFSSYLDSSSALTFTVASDKQDAVISQINGCLNSAGCQGVCVKSSADAVEEAHSLGLSLGKYQAYLEISEYDSSITPEQCQNMTMRELHELQKQLSEESDLQDSHGSGHQHGNGIQKHKKEK